MQEIKNNCQILLFATEGSSTNIIYNNLVPHFPSTKILLENKISNKKILLGRLKKAGLFKSIGQVLFILTVVPILKLTSKKRTTEIVKKFNINISDIPFDKILKTSTINSELTLKIVEQHKPDLIIVNGTRIISKKILEAIKIPIINIHVGVTPQYRGVHGGYWALYNHDNENFGTTIHFVDAGIDSGKIIKQFKTQPNKSDNFCTYPLLQYAIISNELPQIANAVIQNNIQIEKSERHMQQGNIYFHPTLFQYLYKRFTKKIK